MHLIQSCADVRADDEPDALDLSLHEHDAEMLVLRRVRVCSQKLHVIRLTLRTVSATCTSGEAMATHLFPDVVEQASQEQLLALEDVWRVSLVHPVPHELLERGLFGGVL